MLVIDLETFLFFLDQTQNACLIGSFSGLLANWMIKFASPTKIPFCFENRCSFVLVETRNFFATFFTVSSLNLKFAVRSQTETLDCDPDVA